MAANPLLPSEVETYCRQTLTSLSAWEADVLYRVDDAVLAVWNASTGKASRPGHEPESSIPATNTKGLKALFQGLAARRAKT